MSPAKIINSRHKAGTGLQSTVCCSHDPVPCLQIWRVTAPELIERAQKGCVVKKVMGLGGVGKTVTVHRCHQIINYCVGISNPQRPDGLKTTGHPHNTHKPEWYLAIFVSLTGCVLCYIVKGGNRNGRNREDWWDYDWDLTTEPSPTLPLLKTSIHKTDPFSKSTNQ